MEELKILGEHLSRFRKKNNLSCQAVSDSLGISAAHVCRIENGSAKPSFDVLINLSRLMNVPLYYLFLGSTDELDMTSFIASTHQRLKELNWSAERLAKETHLNLFRILDILQGKSKPSHEELLSIANTLSISLPESPINQRINLLEHLLSDLGLEASQIQNITEYVQSVKKES